MGYGHQQGLRAAHDEKDVSKAGHKRATDCWNELLIGSYRTLQRAAGIAGDPLILIDNVTRPLGSGALDAALTAGSIKDRQLGTHQTLEAPMQAVFFATGNNMTYESDTARRVVPIALDPQMERPEERTGFQHSPLLPWVTEQRPPLVAAALTILRAYFAA
jgi:hypothetical protein